MPSAAVFGSTGLVGSYILSNLLKGEQTFQRVYTISRRPPKVTAPHLHAIVDPDTTQWPARLAAIQPPPDVVISALGTSTARAGSIAAQWKIDHDLNVDLIHAARSAGARVFVFISSAGTRGLGGWTPYARMKQGVEDAIRAKDFPSAGVVLRPPFLVGEREEPLRGEWLLSTVFHGVGRLLPQAGRDMIHQRAEVVARAAVQAAKVAEGGKAPARYWVLESREIGRLGREQ
ncbi:hypothetical protein VTK73DRAFT_2235 [Phialemonium thermophilum]|uniref:NAD-dependent epimerase/dehydratase domain-containing protein n=1 Tax=Phialemonium thermophilum TaxID=223376 RepID=A0ABR3X601_9PEZI